ncbi:MAG: 3-isopropylmalate dehydratase small subunit [Synergistetes bacterium]|nr:3-isopropylmalate dehydratase small subunit [Synergistota bacterium]MCX8127275.1 3-isopropylmalate dehydratase small subunit [Synergistota bacterium]MDW8191839.1 3-isopropylmalate dehydratase small subunit [Synergistota bacterium]
MAVLRGRAWVFGDNIDTDLIYHGKYLPLTDPSEMAKHAMEYVPGMEDFSKRVKPGDIVVAGRNFGSGSSREHAVLCLKYLGISGVIAESISRIYYRNAINNGFLVLECPGISKKVKTGDEIEVEPETGRIRNLSTGEEFQANPISGLEKEIMEKGGLIEYIQSLIER